MEPTEDRERTGVPWRTRPFQIVLVSTFFLPLGAPLLSPFLPVIRDVFDLTDLQASYLFSIYFLPGILLSPAIGRVIDRVGRRAVLTTSLVMFGTAGSSILFISEYSVILAVRFVQGVAAAGIFITTVTIIADSFHGVQRNAVFGINVASLSTGRTVFPVLGGILVVYGWRVPFISYLLVVLVGLIVWRTFTEPERSRSRRGTVRRAIGRLATDRVAPLYGATLLVEVVIFGGILTALPFLLTQEFGISGVTIGVIIALTTIASALVAALNGRLSRRFSDYQLIAAGFVFGGLSLVGIGIAPSVAIIGLLVLGFGAGIGLILPSVDAAISDAISSELHAGALSLRNSATGIGRASGPVFFTAIATRTGYQRLFLIAGITTLTIGVSGLLRSRR